MDNLKDILKEKRVIKQFNKKGNQLVHPFSQNRNNTSSREIRVYLYTMGHLWLYTIFEDNGYGEYLRELLEYSIEKKNALFEWEIIDDTYDDIISILKTYKIELKKYLSKDFELSKYAEIDAKSKDKDQPIHRLTRFLVMAELGTANQIFESTKDLKTFFEDNGSIINATYLMVIMSGKESKVLNKVPEEFIDIMMSNMNCYHEDYEIKYYPKMKELMSVLDGYEKKFEYDWYLIPDDDQVIISKFLYSIQIFKELSPSLLGLNGILSGVSTRIIFDNYWQSLYLIKNNEIAKYRDFVLKRMRLHILKRDDGTDVNISELLREVKDGYFDPIPVNGDYFTKSAREYAISLNIKDDYDKYYEFNSEFIHASLTAVYSGIMVPCKNPEHDGHLMIKDGGARLIESIPGIVYLLNKHIDLVNTYLNSEVLPKLSVENFFQSRSEWVGYMKNIQD
ncbi:MAG: DUF5677 domain-containing protein [Catonella sp.]